MWYLAIKSIISGIIIATVSETAKRNAGLGALIISLPLVSILAMLWLWHDTKDSERLAAHANATFWYVLPSMPMFLVLPALLRAGVPFYGALAASCLLTVALYFIMVYTLKHFGLNL